MVLFITRLRVCSAGISAFEESIDPSPHRGEGFFVAR